MRVLLLVAVAVAGHVCVSTTPLPVRSESRGLQERRFADVGGDTTNETELLCHRLHLLPVGSPGRERALRGCPERPSLPSVVKDLPGSVGAVKDKYQSYFDKKRDELLNAKKNRQPTPDEDAARKALDAKYNDIKKMEADFSANAVKRNDDQAKADAAAQQDIDSKAKQWDAVMKDDIRKIEHDADKAADAADKARDALDVKRVADAKAKLKDFEDSVMDAKAKAAGDRKVLQDLDDQIAKMKARRKADEEQRVKDEEQAKQDQQLADSAEKRQREQDRATRAKQRESNANEFQDTLNRARIARDDALKRKELLRNEEAERARLKQRQKDDEDALAANRKSREADAAERQKRMDEYKKAEPDMIKRKKDYEDAEAQRVKRAKDRDEARRKREKDEEDERARLKRAKENEAPDEERPKRDDEEDCKDKKVNCGSGKCYQKINDPDSKRCQCQPGDKGANCEHKRCEYDVTDRTGKSRKQRGNQVDGECVRWKAVYRCKCDQPWRLDVTCVTKDPAKGATKELEVPDQKCRGLRKPENKYAKHTCSLCSRGCRVRRQLEGGGNDTVATESHRALVSEVSYLPEHEKAFKVTCNKRMVANTQIAFAFNTNKKAKTSSSTSSHRRLEKRKREDDDPEKPPHAIVKGVSTFQDCQEICLDRDGSESAKTADGLADESTHCTWVWYDAFRNHCYIFINGEFPDDPVIPPADPSTQTQQTAQQQQTQMQTVPTSSGFVAFVLYPRRFNIYRPLPASTIARKDFGDYRVFFGEETNDEDKLTFAYKHKGAHGKCPANQDTVREAAIAYQSRVPITNRFDLPPELREFDKKEEEKQKESIDVRVTPKGVNTEWIYTFDSLLRVTKVTGVAVTSSGSRFKKFEEVYAKMTRRTKLGKLNAPFAAGHLISAQQKPANFFFNYVPQHANSNSLGAWRYTEDAAMTFVKLGCNLDFVVTIDYGKNGDMKPTEIRETMPVWATQYEQDAPSASGQVSDNGGDDGGGDGNDDGDDSGGGGGGQQDVSPAEAASVYVNDDLLCHYRFRPYTMSIDFKINSPRSSPATCKNLFAAVGTGELLTVSGNVIKTTRVLAYLLQKQNEKASESDVTSLRRVFQVATTKSGSDENRMYTETGNIANLTSIEMDFDFTKATLENLKSTGIKADCLKFDGGKCDKWSMSSKKKPRGTLIRADGQCIVLSGQDNAVLGDPSDNTCAEFEYLYSEHSLTKDAKSKLDLGTAVAGAVVEQGDETRLASLILGRVVIGTKCLQQGNPPTFTTDMSKCWQVRISYYK